MYDVIVVGGGTSAIGNGNEGGFEADQLGDGALKQPRLGRRLWREKLKREHRTG